MPSIISRWAGYAWTRINPDIRTKISDMIIYCVSCEKKTFHLHWYGKAWHGPPRLYWRCEACGNIYDRLMYHKRKRKSVDDFDSDSSLST